MTMNDSLSAALSAIDNNEKISKTQVIVFPMSKIIKQVLTVMKEHGYIGEMKDIDDSKGTSLLVMLPGTLNKCGAIKPRFSVTLPEYEKFEKRFLPAKDFGIIVVSTNQGVMTHTKAKEKKLGGKLLAYCY